MDLIYLRHGQTQWNVEGRLQGKTDIPLNDVGIFGAKKAGKILEKYHIDAAYCSPLSRARQTLKYACPGVPPILDPRLAEWNFGPWEGQPIAPDLFLERWSYGQPAIEGMEQFEDVVVRVGEFYKEIKEKHPSQTVLVVSHGGVSGALHCIIHGIQEGENLRQYCLPNATPVLIREGQPFIILQEEVL